MSAFGRLDLDVACCEKAVILPPEVEEGNREYKLKLVNLTEEQFAHRLTQMNWRLNEGKNEAMYHIGYADSGFPVGLSDEELQESLRNLRRIAISIDCTIFVRHILVGENGRVAQVVVNRREHCKVLPENIPVAVVGDFGSGKSSLIGVLSSGQQDNGKGLSRTQVFQHPHEVLSGRTSSITRHRIFFDHNGRVLNEGYDTQPAASRGSRHSQLQQHIPSSRLRSLSDLDILSESSRILTMIDLAGHEKYFKTTVFGLVSHSPLCCMLAIAAGSTAMTPPHHMTLEHLGIAYVLNVPLIIVITKSDQSSPEALQQTIDFVNRLLKSFQRSSAVVTCDDDLRALLTPAAQDISNNTDERSAPGESSCNPKITPLAVPVFVTSSVTGQGISELRSYLFRLPVAPVPAHTLDAGALTDPSLPMELTEGNYCRVLSEIRVLAAYRVDWKDGTETSAVESVGCAAKDDEVIIEGSVSGGRGVRVGEELYFGPFHDGSFSTVTVRSIHVNRVPVRDICAGQTFTACIGSADKRVIFVRSNCDNDGEATGLQCEGFISPAPPDGTGPCEDFTTSDGTGEGDECTTASPPVRTGEDGEEDDMDSLASSGGSSNCSSFIFPPLSQGRFNGSRQGKFLLSVIPGYAGPEAYMEFDAEVLILHHPKRIFINYQPVVHVGVVRQTARLIHIRKYGQREGCAGEEASLTTGEKAVCRFRFLYYPEYITIGSAVVFREGRTRGIGKIVQRFTNPII